MKSNWETINNINTLLPVKCKKIDYKSILNDIAYRLKTRSKIVDPTDFNYKLFADTWVEMEFERIAKEFNNKINYKAASELYRHCMKYKVDCYAACCRFVEYKLGAFKECPDRIPDNPKYTEQQGYWYNKIVQKTGYFPQSCADILDTINIANGTKKHHNHSLNPVVYVYFNFKEDFIEFINSKHKVLSKHFKSRYVDYSDMAYNNSSDDF